MDPSQLRTSPQVPGLNRPGNSIRRQAGLNNIRQEAEYDNRRASLRHRPGTPSLRDEIERSAIPSGIGHLPNMEGRPEQGINPQGVRSRAHIDSVRSDPNFPHNLHSNLEGSGFKRVNGRVVEDPHYIMSGPFGGQGEQSSHRCVGSRGVEGSARREGEPKDVKYTTEYIRAMRSDPDFPNNLPFDLEGSGFKKDAAGDIRQDARYIATKAGEGIPASAIARRGEPKPPRRIESSANVQEEPTEEKHVHNWTCIRRTKSQPGLHHNLTANLEGMGFRRNVMGRIIADERYITEKPGEGIQVPTEAEQAKDSGSDAPENTNSPQLSPEEEKKRRQTLERDIQEKKERKAREAEAQADERKWSAFMGKMKRSQWKWGFTPVRIGVTENAAEYKPGGFHPIHIGDILKGEGGGTSYKVYAKLGFGRHSTVWLCFDETNQKWRAVKVLRDDFPDDLWNFGKDVDGLRKNNFAIPLSSFKVKGSNGTHTCLVYDVLGSPITAAPREIEDYHKTMIFKVAQNLEYLRHTGLYHGNLTPPKIRLRLDERFPDYSEEKVRTHLLCGGSSTVVGLLNPEPDDHTPQYLVVPINMEKVPHDIKKLTIIGLGNLKAARHDPVKHRRFTVPLQYAPPSAWLTKEIKSHNLDAWSFACIFVEVLLGDNRSLFMPATEPAHADELVRSWEFLLGPLPQPFRNEWFKRKGKEVSGLDCFDHYYASFVASRSQFDLNMLKKMEQEKKAYFKHDDGNDLRNLLLKPRFERDGKMKTPVKDEEVDNLMDLLRTTFQYDPEKRLSICGIIEHVYFKNQREMAASLARGEAPVVAVALASYRSNSRILQEERRRKASTTTFPAYETKPAPTEEAAVPSTPVGEHQVVEAKTDQSKDETQDIPEEYRSMEPKPIWIDGHNGLKHRGLWVQPYKREETESPADYCLGGLHPIKLGDSLNNGRFHVCAKLGHGKHSTVWLCMDHGENPKKSARPDWRAVKVRRVDFSRRMSEAVRSYHDLRADRDKGKHNLLLPYHSFMENGPNGEHNCAAYEVYGPSISGVPGLPIDAKKEALFQVARSLWYMKKTKRPHGQFRPNRFRFCLKDDFAKYCEGEMEGLLGHRVPKVVQWSDARAKIPLEKLALHSYPEEHVPKYLVIANRINVEQRLDKIVISGFGNFYKYEDSMSLGDFLSGIDYSPLEKVLRIQDFDIWSFASSIVGVLSDMRQFQNVGKQDMSRRWETILGPPGESQQRQLLVDMVNADHALGQEEGRVLQQYKTRLRRFLIEPKVRNVRFTPVPESEVDGVVDLLFTIFKDDRDQRLSACGILQHPWFSEKYNRLSDDERSEFQALVKELAPHENANAARAAQSEARHVRKAKEEEEKEKAEKEEKAAEVSPVQETVLVHKPHIATLPLKESIPDSADSVVPNEEPTPQPADQNSSVDNPVSIEDTRAAKVREPAGAPVKKLRRGLFGGLFNKSSAENPPAEQTTVQKSPVETSDAEISTAKTSAAETSLVEPPSVEKSPVESSPVQRPRPVDEPAVEPPPVKQPVTENLPVDQPVVETAPVEQPVVATAPVEQPAVELPPVEQPVTTTPPAEKDSGYGLEKSNTVENVAEETAANRPPVEESKKPIEEASVEEQPAEESFVQKDDELATENVSSGEPTSSLKVWKSDNRLRAYFLCAGMVVVPWTLVSLCAYYFMYEHPLPDINGLIPWRDLPLPNWFLLEWFVDPLPEPEPPYIPTKCENMTMAWIGDLNSGLGQFSNNTCGNITEFATAVMKMLRLW